VLCGLAVSAGFAEYGVPYARDGKISLTATNGMYRVVHTGKQDWALTRKGGNVAVNPGEIYRLACRSAAVPGAPAKQKAQVSVVLRGEKGKVLMWGFGAKDFFAGEACESVFAIPLGATGIQARVDCGPDGPAFDVRGRHGRHRQFRDNALRAEGRFFARTRGVPRERRAEIPFGCGEKQL